VQVIVAGDRGGVAPGYRAVGRVLRICITRQAPRADDLVVATGVWVLYRIVRGWLALTEGRPIE
jgi:hypothetical protein